MKYSTTVTPTIIKENFEQMLEITGWEKWENVIINLKSRGKGNPLWDEFIRRRNEIELTFGELYTFFKSHGKMPSSLTESQYRLHAFLAAFLGVYRNLGVQAQHRLKKSIDKAFDQDHSFKPLLHELTTLTHLMARDFDVKFSEYENANFGKEKNADFIVNYDGDQIEIECKYISVDRGRSIHQNELYSLSNYLYQGIMHKIPQEEGLRILRVHLHDKLNKSQEKQLAITASVLGALHSSNSVPCETICDVTEQIVSDEELNTLRENCADTSIIEFKRAFCDLFSIDVRNCLSYSLPGNMFIVLYFTCAIPDAVFKNVHRLLQEAASKQLPRNSPGILCIRMGEMNREEIIKYFSREHGENSMLRRHANCLFASRRHLYGVVFVADDEFLQETEDSIFGVPARQGYSLCQFFENTRNELYSTDILNHMFGEV